MQCDAYDALLLPDLAVPLQPRDSRASSSRTCTAAADLLTHNTLFTRQPLAVDMLIDILTDRGFFVAYVAEEQVRLPMPHVSMAAHPGKV